MEIDSLHKEIRIILRDFEPRNIGLFLKVLTIEQLILSIKFYVTSWTTLIDMVAALVNEVFNLGFAAKDVKFDLIRRNKHVVNSELPTIFKKYSAVLDMDRMKHHRNEIVHRGKIIDEEVRSLYEAKNILNAKRYSLLKSTHISEEEYKSESAKQSRIIVRSSVTQKSQIRSSLQGYVGDDSSGTQFFRAKRC